MGSYFVRPHICVIGSLNIDHTIRTPRCPTAGETLTARSAQTTMGGKGANQAVACGRASISSCSGNEPDSLVTMIAAIGKKDPSFHSLIAPTLAASGVSTKLITEAESECTGTAYVVVEEGAGCENRILLIPGANHSAAMNDLEGILTTIQEQRTPPDVLVLQGEIPSSTVLGILSRVNSQVNGPKIIFNPAPVFPTGIPLSALRGTAALIMNETEAAQVLSSIETESTGVKVLAPESLQPEDIAQRIHQLAMVQVVIITLGAKGVFYSIAAGRTGYIKGVAVSKVVDTTAAGDTFVGYFAVQFAALVARSAKDLVRLNETIEQAVQVANFAASVTVQRPGASSSIPFAYELDI